MLDEDISMVQAHHVETNRTQHTVTLGGGIRVPLDEVLKVSAAGFNAANSKRNIGNPAPLGYFMWFVGCFTSGFYLLKVKDVEILDALASFSIVSVGVGSYVVGNLEVLCENAFACSAMTVFGIFWMSWGATFTKSFGIAEAYAEAPEQLVNVKAFFFLAWFIAFFFISLATIRSTVVFCTMFFTFTMGLLMLGLQNFLQREACEKAGGIFWMISAVMALASAYDALASPETAYIFGKTIKMPGALTKEKLV